MANTSDRSRTSSRTTRKTTVKRETHEARKALAEAAAAGSGLNDPMLVPHLELLNLKPVLTEGVGDQDLYPELLETICGATDDSQAVEQYNGTLGVTQAFVNAHQRAVAQVQWNNNLASIYTNPGNVSGVRWGTGTMISRDLFITAGHLFDQTGGGWDRPRQNGTANVISPQEIATNMHLNFDYQVDSSGNLRPEQSFAITQLIEYRLGGVDYAICRIAGNPGDTYGWAQVTNTDAAVNDMLCIIGHPAGVPKRVEAGPCTDLNGTQIRYNDIDTLGGNSGSGILQATTGRLVGVHTNGGCTSSAPNDTSFNYGQRITSIWTQSATLQNLNNPILTNVRDDVRPTRVLRDKRIIDDIQTTVSRDKIAVSDLRTTVVRDVIGPNKRFDDVKMAGFDVRPDFDPGTVIDPGVVARPFVLSTPHHAGVAGGMEAADTYESVLADLGAAIAQQQAALDALAAQYEAVVAELQQQLG